MKSPGTRYRRRITLINRYESERMIRVSVADTFLMGVSYRPSLVHYGVLLLSPCCGNTLSKQGISLLCDCSNQHYPGTGDSYSEGHPTVDQALDSIVTPILIDQYGPIEGLLLQRHITYLLEQIKLDQLWGETQSPHCLPGEIMAYVDKRIEPYCQIYV